MYHPNFKEFCQKAKYGNLIPIYKEIFLELETPVSASLKIDIWDYFFLLESVEGDEKIATYSFLGTNPYLVFKSKGRKVELFYSNKKEVRETNPFELLKKLLLKYKSVKEPKLPRFIGGAIGYIGYDVIRFFEKIPETNLDDLKIPEMLFIFVNTLLIFDHIKHRIKIVSNAYLENENLKKVYEKAILNIEQLDNKLRKPLKVKTEVCQKKISKIKIISNLSKEDFKNSVKKAKQYIKDGDIIQVVLSQRFKVKIKANPFDIYRALRLTNPSPYMFYLKFKELKLIGSSPEVFVRVDKGIVEQRPIAGTKKRGKNSKEDFILQQELLADEKEKAEHLMLVDLARNDIGRVCQYNSVKVSDFMTIEKYSHVMHLVSDVKGRLQKDKDSFDVIRACFPAGTVSGAPKIRAMEIIDELEKNKRGLYAGAITYFSYSKNFDSCITIRTILIIENQAYIQAGAGIVADSNPEKEYYETINKAKALTKAIKIAERGLK